MARHTLNAHQSMVLLLDPRVSKLVTSLRTRTVMTKCSIIYIYICVIYMYILVWIIVTVLVLNVEYKASLWVIHSNTVRFTCSGEL